MRDKDARAGGIVHAAVMHRGLDQTVTADASSVRGRAALLLAAFGVPPRIVEHVRVKIREEVLVLVELVEDRGDPGLETREGDEVRKKAAGPVAVVLREMELRVENFGGIVQQSCQR